jgi:hypothetical protein
MHGVVIDTDNKLEEQLAALSPASNSLNQILCIDQSGWVATPAQAIRLSPFASGPSGVGIVDSGEEVCGD